MWMTALAVEVEAENIATIKNPFIESPSTNRIVQRNQFQDALSAPTDEQALQKCRSAH
jgi:hypothetical protein